MRVHLQRRKGECKFCYMRADQQPTAELVAKHFFVRLETEFGVHSGDIVSTPPGRSRLDFIRSKGDVVVTPVDEQNQPKGAPDTHPVANVCDFFDPTYTDADVLWKK